MRLESSSFDHMNSVTWKWKLLVIVRKWQFSYERKQRLLRLTQPLTTAPHRPQPHDEADTGHQIPFNSLVIVWDIWFFLLKICSLAVNTKPIGQSHFSSTNFVFCLLGKREILGNPIFISVQVCTHMCVRDVGKERGRKIYFYPRANF